MGYRLAGGDSTLSCFQALLIAVFGSGIVCHLSSFRSACLAVKRSLIIPQAALSEKMIQVTGPPRGCPKALECLVAGFKDTIGSHGPPAGAGAPGPRRLNAEVKRSQKLIAIFPSEDLLIRLVGTYLIEENDRWVAKSKQYLPAGGRRAMRGGRRRSRR